MTIIDTLAAKFGFSRDSSRPEISKQVRKITDFIDLRDMHAYGGIVMLGYGLNEIHPALPWIVCGSIIFLIGIRK